MTKERAADSDLMTMPEPGSDRASAVQPPVSFPSRTLAAGELRRRFRPIEFLAEKLIALVATASLAAIVMIFIFVFREAAPVVMGRGEETPEISGGSVEEQETFGEEYLGASGRSLDAGRTTSEGIETSGAEGKANFRNLVSTSWQPISAEPKYGILPLIVGSVKVTLIALLVGAPLAILAALFTASFAPRPAREILKPAIELLAGFPSVVIGFFALVSMASVLQAVFGFEYRLNALVGGLAMSLAVIPVIYTVAEDALTAVPKSMTEASLALGAAPWQTALFVTLPAATPGVFAAVLLGFGRAFGETMIVLMATGNAALMGWSVLEPVRTMSATVGAEMAEVVFGDTHYHVLFLIGAVLFAFTFVLNAFAEGYVRRRLLRRFSGEASG